MPYPQAGHGKSSVSWWDTTTPTSGPIGSATTWVGVQFRVTTPGKASGFRFYDGSAQPEATLFVLMEYAQTIGGGTTQRLPLAAKWFTWKSGAMTLGWHQCWFRPHVALATGKDYIVAALFIGGGLYRTGAALASSVTHNNIQFENGFQSTALDISSATLTLNNNANGVDILYDD